MRKVTLMAMALVAVSGFALAGETQIAKGKVQTVSPEALTVAGEDGEVWTFEVTDDSVVIAEGAAHKSNSLTAVGKKTTIDEFVRENQYVTVNYWESDGERYVKKLRVH
jgi:hypothetical protein